MFERIVLLAAFAAVSANGVHAQEYVRWDITQFNATAGRLTARLRFQNTQTSVTDGYVWDVGGVFVSLDGAIGGVDGTPGTEGAVNTGPLWVGKTVAYNRWYFDNPDFPGNTFAYFRPIPYGWLDGGIGLLGCVVPLIQAPPDSPLGMTSRYAGQTCEAGGFDGWATIDLDFFSGASGTGLESKTVDDIDISFFTRSRLIDSYVVPEPSTYAIMASGLAAIGAVARRRRKV